MIKRFLVPVLALAALGLPARADVVAYCDGGCGSNIMSVFNSLTSGDAYASGSPITFGPALGVLSGNEYTDDLTSVVFQATNSLSDLGALDTQDGAGDALTITVPATYTAIVVSIFSQNGTWVFCIDAACDYATLGSMPVSVGYINSSPTAPWTIQIKEQNGAYSVGVNSFNAANAEAAQSATPEVGTLLLIGAGLISMRWMKRLPRPRFLRTPQTA
jgi:hypothetical protein